MSTGEPLADRERDAIDSSGAREGHKKALGDLYRDHYRSMLRVLSARTGSRDTAQEILHEAYARMLELDRPETASFLANYVWKLAWNLVIDGQRRKATRARLDPVALHRTEEVSPSPETLLYEQQRFELLERAIDNLPRKELEAFILRVQHGLTFKEVAKRMSISERMAQLHIASALKYCHKYLNTIETTGRRVK
jgi:RNA polymerase sigma factor (sigma-70 family)